jgi:hypothetical protein
MTSELEEEMESGNPIHEVVDDKDEFFCVPAVNMDNVSINIQQHCKKRRITLNLCFRRGSRRPRLNEKPQDASGSWWK